MGMASNDNLTYSAMLSVPQIRTSGASAETRKLEQVRCGEGVAIRIGPEPCVGTREGVGEA